jgi:hypothetical protein
VYKTSASENLQTENEVEGIIRILQDFKFLLMMVSVYLSEIVVFHLSQIINQLKIILILWKLSQTQNSRVNLLGDFNVPGYDWVNGFPQTNLHYYTKIRGEIVHNATCCLGLQQENFAVNSTNLLDLVCPNFYDVTCYFRF